MTDLQKLLGQMDIYLLDQLLRARIRPGMRIFEAGCGTGRNLVYFLQSGYDVAAVDAEPGAIAELRALAAELAPQLAGSNFRAEPLQTMSFPGESADVVISSAVLHFARDDEEFRSVLNASWRILRPGGLFFCRLASTIGMEGRFTSIGGRRFALPDGTERYLVDEAMLLSLTSELGGQLLDPLKTTVVQNRRCMTTWVLRRVAKKE